VSQSVVLISQQRHQLQPFVKIAFMIDPAHPIAQLLRDDPRYKVEAYALVFEALNYAHKELNMGTPIASLAEEADEPGQMEEERHLTGQELCEAIRQYALDQYGLMAETVFKSWGVTKTGDFGEIVFNLIRVGQMRKTKHDRREHFEDVYDFGDAFRERFTFSLPTES
jgi:uncharacterized repeat protein (TIGR04138 family)